MSIKGVKKVFINSNIDNLIVLCGRYNYNGIFNDFEEVSIGEMLAKKLLEYDKNQRSNYIESSVKQLLSEKNSSKLLVKDIDILFNPNYKIDILKLFSSIERNKKIALIWSGYQKGDELIYSEPCYDDFAKYKITDYNIKTV